MPAFYVNKEDNDKMSDSEKGQKVAPKSRQRIHFLDELRGFAVFCMVFYHAFFTTGYVFKWSFGITLMNFFSPAEPFFAGLFILISGIASNLSHSNIERGAKLFFIAYAVTVVSFFAVGEKEAIRFGILHMLSVSMMLYGILTKVSRLIPTIIGIAVNALLFVFTFTVQLGYFQIPFVTRIFPPAELYKTDILYPLGFPGTGFVSGDYFPLLPWLFLFFAGGFLGKYAAAKKFPSFTYKKHCPPFSFIGRHALIIYVLHQPVIFGICELVVRLLPIQK